MTKAIICNHPRLANICQAMSRYAPEAAWKMQPVPMHPGAESCREGGVMI